MTSPFSVDNRGTVTCNEVQSVQRRRSSMDHLCPLLLRGHPHHRLFGEVVDGDGLKRSNPLRRKPDSIPSAFPRIARTTEHAELVGTITAEADWSNVIGAEVTRRVRRYEVAGTHPAVHRDPFEDDRLTSSTLRRGSLRLRRPRLSGQAVPPTPRPTTLGRVATVHA